MTAEPPGSPVAEEVLQPWRCAGSSRAKLEAAVAGWVGGFRLGPESREDTYLVDPQLRGLSVKVRGGAALEVKVYRGSPGILEVAGCARGRMESWQKWSFPFSPLRQNSGDLVRLETGTQEAADQLVLTGQRAGLQPTPLALGQEPRCEVELTEVRTGGQDWWTLGFEAAGPADLLRTVLEAAAALVFAQALPGGVEPGPNEIQVVHGVAVPLAGCRL